MIFNNCIKIFLNFLDNAIEELCLKVKVNFEELQSKLTNFALTYSSVTKAVDGTALSPIHSINKSEYLTDTGK